MNLPAHFTFARPAFLLSFVLFGICVASEKQAVQPREAKVAGRFVTVTPISDVFEGKVVAAAETIPAGVWSKLQRKGWRFKLAEFVIDVVPSLKDQHPRGWPDWMTWEQVDGVNIVQERLLAFSEQRRNRSGRVVANVRIAGVIRHEVGHAFDVTFSGPGKAYSASPRFRSRYERDTQRMSPAMRDRLQYYLQRGAAGRQETFAEAFAIVLGGGSDETNREQFSQSFREVISIVEATINFEASRNLNAADRQ